MEAKSQQSKEIEAKKLSSYSMGLKHSNDSKAEQVEQPEQPESEESIESES